MQVPSRTPSVRKRPPLSDYDPILGPTLTARMAWPSALHIALAVALRGLDAGIPPASIYAWLRLRTRSDQRFARIMASPRIFHHLVITKARAKRSSASSLPARRRDAVRVARRLVGLVSTACASSVTETGKRIFWDLDGRRVSASRIIDARQCLAIVGLALIDSILDEGRDTVLISGPWLAVQMGVGERKARGALRTCMVLGWVRQVSKRAGSSGRYDLGKKVTRWPSQEARRFAADHPFTVEALVERHAADDPLAEVIACAAHPAVSYDLGVKPWLSAVSMEAGTPLSHLGLARGVRPAQRDWVTALAPTFTDRPEATLVEALDAHAEVSGARGRHYAAESARRQAAVERKAETEAHRAAKKALYAWLPYLLGAHPVPAAGDPNASDWARTVRDAVAAAGVLDAVRPDLAKALAKRLVAGGHQPDNATVIGRKIAGLNVKAVTAGEAA